MDLTVEAVSHDTLRLSLRGAALLASAADIAKSQCGGNAALLGDLDYDRRQQRFTRFDVAALADCWCFKDWFRTGTIVGQRHFSISASNVAFRSAQGRSFAERRRLWHSQSYLS